PTNYSFPLEARERDCQRSLPLKRGWWECSFRADPWRLQYFTHVKTDVDITTEDSDAWQWYPAHRWVYDKLAIAQSQGIEAGPHGTKPPRFPIFSKPIVNLKGMGIGSRVLRSQADYEAHAAPGHFWMRLLE